MLKRGLQEPDIQFIFEAYILPGVDHQDFLRDSSNYYKLMHKASFKEIYSILTFAILAVIGYGQSGNIGIGISEPTQKLSINGAIQIGMNEEADLEPGTVRWNPETNDFEGFNGFEWKSLTNSGSSHWGVSSSIESARALPNDDDSGDRFGWASDIDGEYAVVGAYGDDEAGFDTGAAYVFERTGNTWTEVQKLNASDADDEDWFGFSVAIDGDYIIIGAPYDDASGTDAGAAYIFIRNGESWIQQSKLVAPDGASNDFMGISVDISGDYAIVGASEDNVVHENSGSAYIFRQSVGFWIMQDKLTASDASPDDEFGISVAIDGDYCVVGAYFDDEAEQNAGAAYIFERNGNAWIEQDKVTASNPSSNDRFGTSVDIEDNRFVVGAFLTDHSGNDSGTAYIFERVGDNWIESHVLIAKDASVFDWFGFRVAIKGEHILVSAVGYAPDEVLSAYGCGYIFKFTGTNWIQQSKLVAAGGSNQDELGRSVGLSHNAAIIGAPGEGNAGGVYFWHLEN